MLCCLGLSKLFTPFLANTNTPEMRSTFCSCTENEILFIYQMAFEQPRKRPLASKLVLILLLESLYLEGTAITLFHLCSLCFYGFVAVQLLTNNLERVHASFTLF